VFWEPSRKDLRSIDLEEFSIEAAADQVARYAYPAYLDIRRRLEEILTGLHSEAVWPDPRPDSFMVGGDTLAIVEETNGRGREPTFRIELETDSLPQIIAPGEPAPESSYIDVTGMEVAEVVRLLKDRTGMRSP
jgi:hypothetical protein